MSAAVVAVAVAGATGCASPRLAKDGTFYFQERGARGAAIVTANGLEYRDREDVPQRVIARGVDEPWRAPIGFILPKDGRFTESSRPHVLATTGLAIVLRPSDTRVPSWGGEVLVRVDVIAPAAEGTARWGENVAIVVDGDGADTIRLVDAALERLAGRDRVAIVDAHGPRVVVPLMPASNRSLAVAALKNHLRTRARPARDVGKAVTDASARIAGQVTQRVLLLSDRPLDPPAIGAISAVTGRGVQVATVATRAGVGGGRGRDPVEPVPGVWSDDEGPDADLQARIEAVRAAIPEAGQTAFRDVRLTFEGTPAPSHVLEATGGEARWRLDAGELVLGNVRAGEARTEVLRVTVPSWVPGEKFHFTVKAHVDDLAWGGTRDIVAEVPCVYDDDIERIAKSRHGDVIAYASAMATLRRLDRAFIGDDVARAGGLRRIAEMHARSMQLFARDMHDFATQEQADMLLALLTATAPADPAPKANAVTAR